MPNYDGRMEIRFKYNSEVTFGEVALQHVLTMDVGYGAGDPSSIPAGAVFEDIELVARNSSIVTLADFVDGFADVWKNVYSTGAELSSAELWVYPAEPSQDPVFKSGYTIGVEGTIASGSATRPAQYAIFTFRSTAGGIARITLMEPRAAAVFDGKQTIVTASAPLQALSAYLVALTSPFKARDNAYVFYPLNISGGQNEALWRKYYR